MRRGGLATSTALIVAMGWLAWSGVAVGKGYTVKWWLGDCGGMGVWKDLAKEYETNNPGAKVSILTGSLDKFYAMITAGLMPDLWGPWSSPGLRADINRNWATDLTPYIKRDGKQINVDDFFPGLLRTYRVGGKLYSMPMFIWQDYFFYNAALYAQSGLTTPPMSAQDKSWNWDKMLANAMKISKTDGSGRLATAGVDFYRGIEWNPAYLQLWGAQVYSEAAMRSSVPQQVDWDSPAAVTGFTKAHDLIYKHNVAKPIAGGFSQGKTGQLMDSGWAAIELMKQKKLKWAISTYPWAVTNQAAMWPDGWRMSRVAKNKEEVWRFIKHLTSAKSMTHMTTDPSGFFSASGSARKSVFYETLGRNISKATEMTPADVFQITSEADGSNLVAYFEMICIHLDLTRFLEPMMPDLWSNKVSPVQMSRKLQDVTNRKLPELFKRWVRNIAFTGAE